MFKRLTRPNVRDILTDSEQGRKIIKRYSNQILSKEARNHVLEIIVSWLVDTVKGLVELLFFHVYLYVKMIYFYIKRYQNFFISLGNSTKMTSTISLKVS